MMGVTWTCVTLPYVRPSEIHLRSISEEIYVPQPSTTKLRSKLLIWNCIPLEWHHNERDGVSNHQPHHCWLNRLFRRRSKKTSKLRVTGLCAGNSSVTGEFPAQMASNAENVSIWWRHHVVTSQPYHSQEPGQFMSTACQVETMPLKASWDFVTQEQTPGTIYETVARLRE